MRKFVPVLLVVLLVLLGATAVYFYREASMLQTNPDAAAKKNVTELIQRVGKHIELPQGETPTVATVSDPDRLKSQPFFANAKKGDQVLLYTKARKAYLYDPVADRLVDVAPLYVGAGTSSPAIVSQ